MKRLASYLVTASMVATSAAAGPGVITTSVNFRSGPGTGYASLGKITEGAKVDVSECDASGAWCAVTFDGRKGFVSGKYVEQADPQKPNWPRSFTTGNGATLTLSSRRLPAGLTLRR